MAVLAAAKTILTKLMSVLKLKIFSVSLLGESLLTCELRYHIETKMTLGI